MLRTCMGFMKCCLETARVAYRIPDMRTFLKHCPKYSLLRAEITCAFALSSSLASSCIQYNRPLVACLRAFYPRENNHFRCSGRLLLLDTCTGTLSKLSR